MEPNRHGAEGGSEYRYGFNGKEMDDEVKNVTGSSYDFGARMYDPRVGRWLSMDPMQKKYPGLSPYQFTANNPIIFVDPDGRRVRAMSEEARTIISYSITPEEAKYLKFNKKGYINERLLKKGERELQEVGKNYSALIRLVEDKEVVEVHVAESYTSMGRDGTVSTTEFPEKSEASVKSFWRSQGGADNFEGTTTEGRDYEQFVEYAKRNFSQTNMTFEDDVVGEAGVTLVPFSRGINVENVRRFSVTNNIQLYINSNATEKTQTKSEAHEAYSHALFYLEGKDWTHGSKFPGTPGFKEELEKKALDAETEAENNYDKHQQNE